MSQTQMKAVSAIESVVAEAIHQAMERRFDITADGLSDSEWFAIERMALLEIAKSRLRANGEASSAMTQAVEMAVVAYSLDHPGFVAECRDATDAAREVPE